MLRGQPATYGQVWLRAAGAFLLVFGLPLAVAAVIGLLRSRAGQVWLMWGLAGSLGFALVMLLTQSHHLRQRRRRAAAGLAGCGGGRMMGGVARAGDGGLVAVPVWLRLAAVGVATLGAGMVR